MVLSHDAFCFIDWIDPASCAQARCPTGTTCTSPEDVLPALRERGVTEEQIDHDAGRQPAADLRAAGRLLGGTHGYAPPAHAGRPGARAPPQPPGGRPRRWTAPSGCPMWSSTTAPTGSRARSPWPASGPATGCCGSGRTRSGCSNCCSAAPSWARCSAPPTGPAVGRRAAVRAARPRPAGRRLAAGGRRRGPRVPGRGAGRAMGRMTATTTRRWLDDASRRTTSGSSTPACPSSLLYTAAFDGRPNAALLSHTALLTHSVSIGWTPPDRARIHATSTPGRCSTSAR